MAVFLSPVGGAAAQFLDNNGNPLSGGKLYSYAAGTTTPVVTYTTSAGNVAHTNPIVLNAAGRVGGGGEIWLTAGVSYKFTLNTSTDVLIATYDNIDGINDVNANNIVYDPPFTGSQPTTVQLKLSEWISVKDFGAVGDGIANDTTAFTAARNASNGKYLIPEGTYLVNASPDVWADAFIAAGNTFIKIGATTYDVSNAFCGRLRYKVASNVLTWITDSVTGNEVIGIQNSQPGTATYFNKGLAFTTNSHFIQAQPATNGGSTDLLFQRSTLNADPAGNRFNLTFEENVDRLLLSYATTASGAPLFDIAMQIIAGLTPSLIFPALSLDMKQGYTIQTRAGGALRIQNYPTSATTQSIRDTTTGNVLQKINRSRQELAGVAFDTLFDTPNGVTQPRMWGGVFGDTVSADSTLPVTKNLWSTTGAAFGNQVIGTLMVAIATSNGTLGYRETRFVFDGTTVTLTDIVNTLPVQIVATVAVSGTDLQFQASYAGGIGGGYTVTATINWCGAGR